MAVKREFDEALDELLRLDDLNQRRYRAGPGRPGPAVLTKRQMILITEGIFIRAFTTFERFLEEVFVLYARGKPGVSGEVGRSFILPRDGNHARELLRSGMNFLEWNSPDILISRAETYLSGGPIKSAIALHRDRLNSIRRVRNAIAHRSDEAWQKYLKVVISELRAMPLSEPDPGELLMHSDLAAPHQHLLITYLGVLKSSAAVAAN